MIYVALVVIVVLAVWFLGKMSKPACALAGLLGILIAWVSNSAGSLPGTGFGVGLFAFSAFVFLIFNGGRW